MSKSNGCLTFEKEVSENVEKEIREIAKAIVKANNRILKLGYTSYLAEHGSWNIVDGDTHVGTDTHSDQSVVVANFILDKIDAGSW